MTASNDSPDLEALFDSVAAEVAAPPPVVAPPKPRPIDPTGDSDELQALFDSVSAASVRELGQPMPVR